MKTKDLILATCALIFAICSAFATLEDGLLVDETIQVDTEEEPGLVEGCTNQTAVLIPVTATCAGTGFTCVVTVNSTKLPGGSAVAPVRNSSGTILTNASASPVGSITNNCISKVYWN